MAASSYFLNRGYYAPNPEDYGWENDNGALIQNKLLRPSPLIYLSCANVVLSANAWQMQVEGYVMCNVLSQGNRVY